MFCMKCGNQLQEGATFCGKCGAAVTEQKSNETTQDTGREQVAGTMEQVNVMAVQSPKKTVKKAKASTVVVVIQSLLMFLTWVLTFASVISIGIHLVINEDNVVKLVEDFDIGELEVDGKSVVTMLDEELERNDLYSVNGESVEELLEEIDVQDFVDDYAIQFTEYVCSGEEFPEIEADDVTEIILDHADLIEAEYDIRLNPAKVHQEVEKAVEDVNAQISELEKESGQSTLLKTVQIICGPVIMISCLSLLALVLILMIVLYALDRSGIYRAFRGFGIASCVAAILSIVGMVISSSIIKSVVPMVIDEMSGWINAIMGKMIMAGVIMAGIGIVSIVVGIVMSKIFKNSLEK